VNEVRATRGASGEGVLNHQARLFLIAWTMFLCLAGMAVFGAIVEWMGVGQVYLE
jgi:hypothetical protein